MTTAKLVSFTWKPSVNPELYKYEGPTGAFKAGGKQLHRPMVGDIVFQPNTGNYYWEVHCNGDNMKVGLATAAADLTADMSNARGVTSCYLQNGQCEKEGVELKRVWRLLVPVSGANLGFLYDSNNGTLQLWVNLEYHGMIVHPPFGLKGQAVSPAIGIAGLEDNNRNIGTGMKSATVSTAPRLPRGITAPK